MPDNTEDRYVSGTYNIGSWMEIDKLGTLYKADRSVSFVIDTMTQQLVQISDTDLDVTEVEVIAQMLQVDPSVFWPQQDSDGATP